jgi:hypothetical protein
MAVCAGITYNATDSELPIHAKAMNWFYAPFINIVETSQPQFGPYSIEFRLN